MLKYIRDENMNDKIYDLTQTKTYIKTIFSDKY